MAMQLILRRDLRGLTTVTAHDAELLSGIPMGREFTATLTQKRSQRQNRFYWCLLGKIVDNHNFYQNSKPLHLWLKTRLGYVEKIVFHDGTMRTEVSSTAFDKMDGFDIRPFMDAALEVLCTEVLPGITKRELLAEVEGMLGDRYEALFPHKEAA